jgi:hypothetical protein
MKRLALYLLILFGVVLVSCEQVIENPELPFNERITIYGILEPNVPLELYVHKTIPPLSNEPSFPILSDANVLIETEGVNYSLYVKDTVINMRLYRYYTSNELNIQEGKRYNLTVQWNGKTVKSSTFIPSKPIVSSLWYSDTSNSDLAFFRNFRTNISAKNIPDAVLMGLSVVRDTLRPIHDMLYLDNPYEITDYNFTGDSTILSFSRGFDDPYYRNSPYLKILAFDPAFLSYLNTIERRNSDVGIFSGGGGNPVWNVYGDGFGLFLGVNPGYAVNINK